MGFLFPHPHLSLLMPISLPNYQLTSGGQPAPLINGNAAAAPFTALQSVASGINQSGKVLSGIAQDMLRVKNATDVSESRQALAENYSQFRLDLQSETDPQARLDKTTAFLEQQESSIFNPDHAPIVRDQLTQHFSDFASRATIFAAEDAQKLSVKRATLAFQSELTAAKESGNREQYEAARDTARDALGLVPEEIHALDDDFDRTTQILGNRLQAQDSPLDAIESLESDSFLSNNPHLTPDDQQQLLRFAKSQAQHKRSEEIDLLEEALIMGKLNPVDIEAAPHLTIKDRRSLATAYEKSKGEEPISQQEYLNAWKVADTLRAARTDPKVTDDAYRLIHNEARADILARVPPSLQGDLKKELGYLSPAGRDASAPAKPSDRAELESIARSQITRAHNAGALGETGSDASYAANEKSARRAEDIRLEVKKFITDNPKATAPEIRAFTDSLIGNSIGSDTTLLEAIPAPFSIGDDIDFLINPNQATDLVLPPKNE